MLLARIMKDETTRWFDVRVEQHPQQGWLWLTDSGPVPEGFRKSDTPWGPMFCMGPFKSEQAATSDAEDYLSDFIKSAGITEDRFIVVDRSSELMKKIWPDA
jgi:hypothetical protein